MIKIITWITKLILVALTTLLFGSCHFNYDSIKGSGKVTSEKRTVEGKFNGAKVSSAIHLIIEQADKTEIIVEADDNLHESIMIAVENGQLVISSKPNMNIRNGTRIVKLKMPLIEELQASSASKISSVNTLKGAQLNIKTSSAASTDLSVEMDYVNCDSSSGSTIKIDGLALKLNTEASSGSSIKAFRLLVNETIADASSGATIQVHPVLSLKAEASSGASVEYDIAPKTIEKKTSSGGSVSQE